MTPWRRYLTCEKLVEAYRGLFTPGPWGRYPSQEWLEKALDFPLHRIHYMWPGSGLTPFALSAITQQSPKEVCRQAWREGMILELCWFTQLPILAPGTWSDKQNWTAAYQDFLETDLEDLWAEYNDDMAYGIDPGQRRPDDNGGIEYMRGRPGTLPFSERTMEKLLEKWPTASGLKMSFNPFKTRVYRITRGLGPKLKFAYTLGLTEKQAQPFLKM